MPKPEREPSIFEKTSNIEKRLVRSAEWRYQFDKGRSLKSGHSGVEMDHVRRVVTGHDERGKSMLLFDGPLSAGPVPHDRFVWTTNSEFAAATTTADAALRPHRLEPLSGGSIFRVVEFPPEKVMASFTAAEKDAFFRNMFAGMDAAHCRVDMTRSPGMHKTSTLDYVVVLRGEITLLLDEGEATLKPGDVVVQQGGNHDWVVRGDAPALIAVVMLDTKKI